MASISMSQIKELVGSTSSSLREYSMLAGFSAPDSMTEFIGYNPTPGPIDFTYTFGGEYRGEGTLLVTSATGGTGTKTWYLTGGGTTVGPFSINTNTQTGLTNQIYTMTVKDSASPTPAEKIYQYTFDLPRKQGPILNTLYFYFRTDGQMNTPTPTSVGQFTSVGTVESSPSADGTTQDTIWTSSTKYRTSPSSSGPTVVIGWVGYYAINGTFYYKAANWFPNDNTTDTDFDIAYKYTIRNVASGFGTALS
jgi:hypothetical protein